MLKRKGRPSLRMVSHESFLATSVALAVRDGKASESVGRRHRGKLICQSSGIFPDAMPVGLKGDFCTWGLLGKHVGRGAAIWWITLGSPFPSKHLEIREEKAPGPRRCSREGSSGPSIVDSGGVEVSPPFAAIPGTQAGPSLGSPGALSLGVMGNGAEREWASELLGGRFRRGCLSSSGIGSTDSFHYLGVPFLCPLQ